MKKISSDFTLFLRKTLPAIWISSTVVFCFVVSVNVFSRSGQIKNDVLIPILFPVFTLLLGWVMWRIWYFPMVDEAYYDETSFLFIKRGKELRVKYSDIKKISFLQSRPPKIEVELNRETELGEVFYFMPKTSFWAFKMHPDILELLSKFKT